MPRPSRPASRSTVPLPPWILAAGLALVAELWLSGEHLQRLRPAHRQRVAVATVALATAAFGPVSSWLASGDEALADGRPEEALGYYREAERTGADDARTQIRIGNALYRLDRIDQAASAYLEALRALRPGDDAARFAASFNLGNTLVAQKHFEEARDAYWAALLARPDEVEAKFNYEFALSRILELPPAPETEPSPSSKRDGESSEPAPSTDAPARGEPQPSPVGLDEREAERWLATLDEPVGDALRRQVTNEFDGKPRARPGAKTW